MRIFVDVDGTLTEKQCARSVFKSAWRQDVIDKVKQLQAEGHEIIFWTGNTEYAKQAAEAMGFENVTCVGKPQLWVDNEKEVWGRRICRRMVTPEKFLEMEF